MKGALVSQNVPACLGALAFRRPHRVPISAPWRAARHRQQEAMRNSGPHNEDNIVKQANYGDELWLGPTDYKFDGAPVD